ncbi:MAG: CHAT domain-containing protein, partial [Algicola sp.]|nr:CHAT domain-containing protein [Algicola sp.]
PDLYGSILQSLGFDYFSLKDYYKSIKYYRMAVDIFEKTYSSQSLKTANLYFNIANSYSNSGDFHLAKGFYLSSLYSTLDNMKNTLFTMTESEKNAYLTFKLNTFFSSINSLAVKYNDSTINETIYNNSLIQKALVLKSTSSIKNRILESNNKQLLLRYEKFLNLKKQLAELYLDENSENEELISSLELKANNLEKGITVESLDYKQYEMKLNADWKDVRSKLSKNEASIEFVNFYYFDKEWTEDIYYCALVLKANSSPEFVFLFKEKDLLSKLEQNSDNNQKSIEALYNKNNGLYELIWKPLENYLQGVSKVHISSSGILHKISFASIKNGDGDYISKKIEISNYYSTADILKKDKTKTIDFKTALLVGGVDYGKQENGWNYLPGTKLEIESINETLNENKIKSEILTNDIATKANFKEKSFNKDIIHIATHGYFIPELSKKESNKIKEYGLVLFDRSINDKRDAFEYNNPLLRSGLVLAESVNNQNLSEKSNSIFYALEVSNLNLFGTDLVILSACETGLGDIKNTDKEGVYGLQRAFKMAGVDNIIVSLWKVPDKETKEFMETFYNNLFIHNDITEAFVSTQKAMSQKYGLYYWGAFVLIK